MKEESQQTLVAMEVELRMIQDANETILHVSNRMTLTTLICVVNQEHEVSRVAILIHAALLTNTTVASPFESLILLAY